MSIDRCECNRLRRGFIVGAAGLLLIPAARAQGRDLPPIAQPESPTREAFMRRALEMRRISVERGDQAYGAVIVKDGRIVGEGISAVITANDPTAHAEMQGIRDAARRLGTRDLAGCEMYGTSRACPMCEAGAYWARVSRMYYGEGIADAGAPRLSR
jgi:tRNA(Arg) A34 adenosine deaminase TadA